MPPSMPLNRKAGLTEQPALAFCIIMLLRNSRPYSTSAQQKASERGSEVTYFALNSLTSQIAVSITASVSRRNNCGQLSKNESSFTVIFNSSSPVRVCCHCSSHATSVSGSSPVFLAKLSSLGETFMLERFRTGRAPDSSKVYHSS